MPALTVTRTVEIPARTDQVWEVISDPVWQPRLDPRVRLLESTGVPGEPGSSYRMELRYGLFRARPRHLVVAAEPGRSLSLEVWQGRRRTGRQGGVLTGSGSGVRLEWTVEMPVSRLSRGRAERWMGTELDRWLTALSAAAAGLERP